MRPPSFRSIHKNPRLLAVTCGSLILGAIRFLLAAIWPGEEFAIVREAANSAITFAAMNFGEACTALHPWIMTRASVGDDSGLWAHALEIFLDHRQRSEQSRVAYDPKRISNPSAMFWPNPSDPGPRARPLYGELPFARRFASLDKKTRIGSAGSCFAIEIKKHLKKLDFNYVETEENDFASANWGMHYNALAFLQTVEWAFGLRERPAIVYPSSDDENPKYRDPFREGVLFDRVEDAEPERLRHREAARSALLNMDYLVLTLGLIEIWRLAFSDDVLARYPWKAAPELIRSEMLTIQDNVAILNQALKTLKSFNPGLRLIVTVSPVPLYATFQAAQKHVVEATQLSKSVLRIALEQFVAENPDDVSYFPAFETVMWCTENRWSEDMRHVSDEAVGNVMRLFERIYIE